MAQKAKNLPAMRETQAQSLGQGDPLEKAMVTHSRILARRDPWTEEPAVYSPWGHKGWTRLSDFQLPSSERGQHSASGLDRPPALSL